MRVMITTVIDVKDQPYADALAYLRYEYDSVPQNLLSDESEDDFDETVINAVEYVVQDLLESNMAEDAEQVLSGWSIESMQITELA